MTAINQFPQFSRLTLELKESVELLTKKFPSYSDFNFVSMYTWDSDEEILVSLIGDNLVVKFCDYIDGGIFLSFLGTDRVAQTIDSLVSYCSEKSLPTELSLLGEVVIDSLEEKDYAKYKVTDDRDNYDYILSTEVCSDPLMLPSNKRTKYNNFVRSHEVAISKQEFDPGSINGKKDIIDLIKHWKVARLRSDSDVKREFDSIIRCIDNSERLSVRAYGIYIADRLVAFTMFEVVTAELAALHFGKSDTEIVGSNEYLQLHLAEYLKSIGVTYMNNEQDLGIEGLRKSKESSMPVKYLKKYTLRKN